MRAKALKLGTLLVCGMAVPAYAAGGAQAASLVNREGTITYIGSDAPDSITFRNLSATMSVVRSTLSDPVATAMEGCTVRQASDPLESFDCPAVGAVVIDGVGGDDVIAGPYHTPMTATGGPGNDQLSWGGPGSSLSGGPGDDRFSGLAGGTTISGGDGDDTVTVSASAHTVPVAFSLDGVANDGAGANLLPDVENLKIGEPIAIEGGGPYSTGPYTLIGSDGPNRLTGGNSGDLIVGGAGADTLSGLLGDDTILARDGIPDQVSCGDGLDAVRADPADVVDGTCEQVYRAAGARFKDPTLVWSAAVADGRVTADASSKLKVRATAAYGISSVRFLVDARVLCTVTRAPYACPYQPKIVKRHMLSAIVTDAFGQQTTIRRTVRVVRARTRGVKGL